jgi:hypothetical protein
MFLVVCAGCEHQEKSTTSAEGVLPIALGMVTNANGGDFIGYHFYALPKYSNTGEKDFLLVFQNINSKFVTFQNISVTNFSLQDSNGKYYDLALRSSPCTIALGETTSLHIAALSITNTSLPLCLTLKSTVMDIPLFLSIPNIPSKL